MTADMARVLPGGVEIPFAQIADALARGRDPAMRTTPPRTLTATLVAVSSGNRFTEAAEILHHLATRTAVRTILISEGHETRPRAFVSEDAVAIPALKAEFVNNAVAALRLSSLPTLVWWRGCSSEMLDDLAHLADRIVLDDPNPKQIWARAAEFFDRTAFTDLRWTLLTRWRTLMAQLFDIPEVQAARTGFNQLFVKGNDSLAASLYAAWLSGALGRDEAIALQIDKSPRGVPLEEIRLSSDKGSLLLRLAASGTCVVTSTEVQTRQDASRTVPLGDQSVSALLAEELRIRVRDGAFERAVKKCLEMSVERSELEQRN